MTFVLIIQLSNHPSDPSLNAAQDQKHQSISLRDDQLDRPLPVVTLMSELGPEEDFSVSFSRE